MGIGDKPAIALIFLAGTWPLLINSSFGVRNIERTLIKVARAARASEFLVMKDIILPAALPAIFTGLRLAYAAANILGLTRTQPPRPGLAASLRPGGSLPIRPTCMSSTAALRRSTPPARSLTNWESATSR